MSTVNILIFSFLFSINQVFSADISEGEPLSYVWVGVPTKLNHLHSIMGHDFHAPVLTAKKLKEQEKDTQKRHAITFYCLDVFIEHYKNIFNEQDVDINVVGINDYLSQLLLGNRLEKRLAIRFLKVFKPITDREKVDNFTISFISMNSVRRNKEKDIVLKDGFSLLLLSLSHGYILDTNMVPGKGLITLPSHKKIYAGVMPGKWCEQENMKTDGCHDCFIMYTPKKLINKACLCYLVWSSECRVYDGACFAGKKLNHKKFGYIHEKDIGLFKASFETHRKNINKLDCIDKKRINDSESMAAYIQSIYNPLMDKDIEEKKYYFFKNHPDYDSDSEASSSDADEQINDPGLVSEYPFNYVEVSFKIKKNFNYYDEQTSNDGLEDSEDSTSNSSEYNSLYNSEIDLPNTESDDPIL